MTSNPLDLEAAALLDEPSRRALYDAIIGADHPLGRDEAATTAGVSRALAAFHLDRLAEAGLLETEYRRLSGRSGPGAGRPSKLYRRGSREIRVSLPERRYDVAAELFAEALESLAGTEPPAPLLGAAHGLGESLGKAARNEAGARPSRRRLRTALQTALRDRGYEPFEAPGGDIRLRNCPFHALVGEHRDLVCGTNLALTDGVVDGLGDPRLEARLDSQPGLCCVVIADRGRPSQAP
jgi:predicted ArsR family transcriptional regulator